jgi:hypothetical protein
VGSHAGRPRRSESATFRCPRAAIRTPDLSCVGTHRIGRDQKVRNGGEQSRLWARKLRRAWEGMLGTGREKGAQSGRGPGDCITAAPPPENGLRTAATIMALGPGRASRARSRPRALRPRPRAPSERLQTFPPLERPPPFCVRVYVRPSVCVWRGEVEDFFFFLFFSPSVLVVVNLIGIGCAH